MPLPDLLLGTHRLQSDIKAQSQQLEHDIEQVKSTSAQLRHTAVARLTSPLGLLSAAGSGFIAGKIAGKPSQPQRIAHQTISRIGGLTLSTVRAIGLQVVIPMAVEWLQSKFAKHKNENNSSSAAADNTDTK